MLDWVPLECGPFRGEELGNTNGSGLTQNRSSRPGAACGTCRGGCREPATRPPGYLGCVCRLRIALLLPAVLVTGGMPSAMNCSTVICLRVNVYPQRYPFLPRRRVLKKSSMLVKAPSRDMPPPSTRGISTNVSRTLPEHFSLGLGELLNADMRISIPMVMTSMVSGGS